MRLLVWNSPEAQEITKILDQQGLEYKLVRERKRGDFIIIAGGDGQVIEAFHAFEGRLPPIIGIRTGGNIGFLTFYTLESLVTVLKRVEEGNYRFIEASVGKAGERFFLNEVAVLGRGRPIFVEIELEEEKVGLRGDGVIVANPLGSTAYNLSAGGPVVKDWSLPLLIITPLAPMYQFPPLVVYEPVTLRSEGELYIDGRKAEWKGEITILPAQKRLRFVKIGPETFLERLERRLRP